MKRVPGAVLALFIGALVVACSSNVAGSAESSTGAQSSGAGSSATAAASPIANSAEVSVPSSSSEATGSVAASASAVTTETTETGDSGSTASPSSTTSQAGNGGNGGSGNGGSGNGGSGNGGSGNGGSGNGGSGNGGGSGSTAPAFVSLEISCSRADSKSDYQEFVKYELANATGLAISVDNPGAVGGYKTVDGAKGTVELPNNGCYSDAGEQVYDFDTVGGSGKAAHKEIKRTGSHPRHPAPAITEADLKCTQASDGSWNLTLEYEVDNATGIAVSVDNPGAVGAYGTYDGESGSVDLPDNACYSDSGAHEFDLSTVGGTDPQASKTLHYTGSHQRPGSGATTTDTSTTVTTTSG